MQQKASILFILFLAASLANCGGKYNKAARPDACSLISDVDIQAVQGEAVIEKTASENAGRGIVTSQCFYRLPTFSRSINLEVTRPNASSNSPLIEEFWVRRFGKHREATAEELETREEPHDKTDSAEREEEKEHARPTAVDGVGDEAFWTGSQINGSLYFRKNETIVRVSIGGPDDQSTKIGKAKSLAETILKNL